MRLWDRRAGNWNSISDWGRDLSVLALARTQPPFPWVPVGAFNPYPANVENMVSSY